MKNWKMLTAAVLIMLGLPWAAVTFAPGDAGMAVCFLLFFAVDPIYAVIVGCLAGRDVRKLWFQPLLTALLFLVGTWVMFDMGEPAFARYALVYLALGYGVMGIRWIVKNRDK